MSAAQPVPQLPVQQVLNKCRRQIFVHTVLAGVATIATVVVGYIIFAAILDYLIGLPSLVRVFTLVSLGIVAAVVIWKSLIAPLKASLPAEQLGAAVDLSAPELNESLATLISIERPGVTQGESGSPLMRRHLKEQVAQQLTTKTGDGVVDAGKTRRRCGVAGLVIMLGILPFVVWPSGSELLMQRMLSPFSNLATVSNLYFEVGVGNQTVAKGSTVEISGVPMWRTSTPGERPDQVDLRLIAANGHTETVAMMFDAVGNRFVAELSRITETVQFQIVGGGATTQVYTITVVDAPEIQTAMMTATPPLYAGRAISRFDGMVGEMEVFETSELEILLEFNKPVKSATLVWGPRDARPVTEAEMLEMEFDDLSGEEVMEIDPDAPLMAVTEPLSAFVEGEISADGLAAVFKMTAEAGGDFAFEVLDEHQLTNATEPERHLTVTFDAPPTLDVSGIHDVDRFRPDDILPVNCLATDDIGIGDLELHYQINDSPESFVAAKGFDRGATQVKHRFRLELKDLGVVDGDVMSVRVRVTDERPLPEPQVTWSKQYTIGIADDAKAAGQRAMEEDTREMVEALKQLEKLLEQDVEKANELKNQTKRGWNNNNRDEAQRLSEKEQQQGQILEELAGEVATHPLMEESSEALRNLSAKLREDLPRVLDQAVDADRRGAHQQLQDAAAQLEDAREKLHEEIRKIENVAQLEQDLAELNRLALEAEQLAQNANQLEQDRNENENKPADVSDRDWEQQLDQRQQELMQEQAQLSDELGRLIQEKQELLKAAQRAQREQLRELSDVAKQLAQRQQQLADGVKREAQDAAADAKEVARQLEKAKADVERLNDDLPEQDAVRPADIAKLEEAIEQLRQGDLAQPEQQIGDVAEELNRNEQQLQQAGQPEETDEQAAQRQNAAEQSAELADRLEDIQQRASDLRNERVGQQPQNAEQANGADQPADEGNQPANEPADAVEDLLERMDALAEEARQVADGVQADPEAGEQARRAAEQAAEQAQQGANEAANGQFSEAANEAGQAASSADQASRQLGQEAQQERRQQAENLGDELREMSQELRDRQQDDAAQVAAQQGTQQAIAEDVAELPEQMQDLAERLNLEALQMADQAQQAQAAQQAAGQAQQSSQQASSNLQEGDLQDAGEAGQETAEQLQQLAESAQQAGQSPGESSTSVPTEVGESVAEALQDLAQAAQAMQQNSNQQGQGQQGQGQQGQGQSGSQQLSSAAQALAEAAQGALPGQFNPGQMSEGGESSGSGRDAAGNAAMWNGLVPDGLDGPAGSRDWGKLNEELNTETSDGVAASRDSEYEALIRMYFREVAKATSKK